MLQLLRNQIFSEKKTHTNIKTVAVFNHVPTLTLTDFSKICELFTNFCKTNSISPLILMGENASY